MKTNLSKNSEVLLAKAVNEWLSGNHCVYVGNTPNPTDFKSFEKNRENFLSLVESEEGSWLFGIKHLDFDSKHFEKKIGKLWPFITPKADPHSTTVIKFGESHLNRILEFANTNRYSHLSVLVHPEDTVGIRLLSQSGFELMDTTVLIKNELANLDLEDKECHLFTFREAVDSDLNSLQEMAETCFGNRENNINRFNSDPKLDQKKVQSLYGLWIYNSLGNRGMADKVFVLEQNNYLVGFLTINLDFQNKTAEIPLNAINPAFKGQGLYKKLIFHTLLFLQKMQMERVEIWTHVSNFAVQNTWQSYGAKMKFCAHQFRLSLEH